MKRFNLFILILLSSLQTQTPAFSADVKWQATVPDNAQNTQLWEKTIASLRGQGMLYGAMASAYHMATLFPDVVSKEIAYKTIISVIDEGYPSVVRDVFIPADLEPNGSASPEAYEFANSYYLYKAVLSKEKGFDRWADYYLDKVDKDNFPKYIYSLAVDAYAKDKLPEALELLNKALSKKVDEQPRSLVTKMMRTMARIYFEQGQYEKSLDIYNSFLLQLNPISPSDWLEAAWDNFHLKRYPEALGNLYNLESKAASNEEILEKYNLRALIYRATCSVANMEALNNSFLAIFQPVLDGIKRGEPLSKFPVLLKLQISENAEYNQLFQVITGLRTEWAKLRTLPAAQRSLAEYVYKTELLVLDKRLAAISNEALSRSANQVLIIGEQMRFLRFDIERSKLNPDNVFKTPEENGMKPVKVNPDGLSFEVRWLQYGDYWLDERNKLKGVITNQCSE